MGRTTSSYYGMYAYYNEINIFHNTIYMDGTGASRGIYVGGTGANMVIKNNIIVTLYSTSYPIYEGTAGCSQSDYNCLYAPNYAGYSGAAMGFTAWQNAGKDVHGMFVKPSFVMKDSNEFLKLSAYAGMYVPAISTVKTDRLGKPRAGSVTEMISE